LFETTSAQVRGKEDHLPILSPLDPPYNVWRAGVGVVEAGLARRALCKFDVESIEIEYYTLESSNLQSTIGRGAASKK
jgi:hypothetical protein